MYWKFVLVVTIAVTVSGGIVSRSNEDDIDTLLNLLLNEGSVEVDVTSDEKGEPPSFQDGFWRCGLCDNLAQLELVYSEINTVAFNDVTSGTYQVGLSMPGMVCVTVAAPATIDVTLVEGSCAGAYVTFSVSSSSSFVTNVYGDKN